MRILTLLCCALILSACGIKGALIMPPPSASGTTQAPPANGVGSSTPN
ncbi:LPS translocon maturation chaperone LptM [Uliginosibacterium gangwonense]|nr:lipoprotein [Uliginosibacterium gangwonense]